MTTRPVHETAIEADPQLPTIRITREFDAPVSKVFRAWIDPELVGRWLGPKDLTTEFDTWELRTGGHYRYRQLRDGEEVAAFYGSFHEVRPESRLVQTFTYEGYPDGVALDTATFEDIGGGRTRVTVLSLVASLMNRDMILSSGMDRGVIEGYEQLDDVLSGLD
ncbi:SRPBCC family protein [Streptacidiphilus anmyonensis]|uniref:SRPBCC family protein n=1 Tax=Streptacidiphilus anmyonensis TaxID=405782 RepID=UPI0005A87D1D|nr:SRPBCC family protein [Streptacidiphilus anmyonensis]